VVYFSDYLFPVSLLSTLVSMHSSVGRSIISLISKFSICDIFLRDQIFLSQPSCALMSLSLADYAQLMEFWIPLGAPLV
jgi:hypothetical protein